jgi:hypothetical protein
MSCSQRRINQLHDMAFFGVTDLDEIATSLALPDTFNAGIRPKTS